MSHRASQFVFLHFPVRYGWYQALLFHRPSSQLETLPLHLLSPPYLCTFLFEALPHGQKALILRLTCVWWWWWIFLQHACCAIPQIIFQSPAVLKRQSAHLRSEYPRHGIKPLRSQRSVSGKRTYHKFSGMDLSQNHSGLSVLWLLFPPVLNSGVLFPADLK